MRSVILALLSLALGSGASAGAAAWSSSDAGILSRLHAIDQLEIHAGNLAAVKGSDPRVRRYGRLLAVDHQETDQLAFDLARQTEAEGELPKDRVRFVGRHPQGHRSNRKGRFDRGSDEACLQACGAVSPLSPVPGQLAPGTAHRPGTPKR